jgi:hypothetical protein
MHRREFMRVAGGAALLAGLPSGCTDTPEGRHMKIEDLKMPPFNTTFAGVLKGALDYYKIAASAPHVFGASGHAFLINIHKELCPSGPYCWKRGKMDPLIANLGLRMDDLGFFSPENSAEERAKVEKKLRGALDQGIPCSLLNLENQMITGYDEEGFLTAQPWAPRVDFPPARLSFGSWKEFGEKDTFHVNFYILRKVTPSAYKTAVLASLDYAVDLHANPGQHNLENYGVGPEAYTKWIGAAAQFGSSHGNWWNATVWSECRNMASKYFAEIGQEYAGLSSAASELSKAYADIAGALGKLSSKEMDVKTKVGLLEDTRQKEAGAIKEVAALAASLRGDGPQHKKS